MVYLDAGYGYAFYDSKRGDIRIDLVELEKKLAQLHSGQGSSDENAMRRDLFETSLPRFAKLLKQEQEWRDLLPPPPSLGYARRRRLP